jgi:beta-mannosidase
MSRGRVRGVTGTSRSLITRGWQIASAKPAGDLDALPGGLDTLRWIDATVPGTVASALRAAKAWSWDKPRSFDDDDWWWRVSLGGATGTLGIDGIATLWDAWIDGELVARGDGAWARREIDVRGGRDLFIRCKALAPELAKKRPRPRWKVPMLEQQQLRWLRTPLLGRTPGWSPPCPPVGPWRPVWLEERGALAVGEVTLDVQVVGHTGFVQIGAQLGEVDSATLVVGEHRAQLGVSHGAWTGALIIEDPELWWPHTHGEPARYPVHIETPKGTVDLGHVGFRTLRVDETGGDFRILVNDVPVFCRGACWTPLDVVGYAAAPDAYYAAVDQLVAAGMNMLRVGGTMTYEDDALYDALDERGVLLWHDAMCANMDYPDDLAPVIANEVSEEFARLAARPCVAVICGSSEGEQQAAMFGTAREQRERTTAFETALREAVRLRLPHAHFVRSSSSGGAFPHAANAGPSSYYGVGAYRRPLEDARRSEVRFASECLAFANIPNDPALPRVHSPEWKTRAPRDLGAGWDFDDVRDHYVHLLYGVDPVSLRYADHDRYLALGRAASTEVIERTLLEWRRKRSQCRGALLWFLRDLWPGAGWGIIDAHGRPKSAYHGVRRACAPIAVAMSDEGVNGVAVHVINDSPEPVAGTLELTMWRGGETNVGRGSLAIQVPPHDAIEVPAASLFESWIDLSWAYRFGPPVAQVLHATFADRDAFFFPAGLPSTREPNVGLTARAAGDMLEIATTRFAQSVSIDAPGYVPGDDGFHLAPGQTRRVRLQKIDDKPLRGHVSALNSDATARIEVLA